MAGVSWCGAAIHQRAPRIQPRELACVEWAADDSTFGLTRYGMKDGALAVTAAKWTAPVRPAGGYDAFAGTPGRNVLTAGMVDGKLTISLLSSTGAQLTSMETGAVEGLGELGADGEQWIGAGPSWVARGTYTTGGSAASTQPKAMPLPKMPLPKPAG